MENIKNSNFKVTFDFPEFKYNGKLSESVAKIVSKPEVGVWYITFYQSKTLLEFLKFWEETKTKGTISISVYGQDMDGQLPKHIEVYKKIYSGCNIVSYDLFNILDYSESTDSLTALYFIYDKVEKEFLV